jgi:competence protein ComEC
VIDVGQGDSILAQTPEGDNILVDAGTREAQDEITEELEKQDVDEIDLFVSTHPHSDHTGSMQYILEHYPVRQILITDASEDTRTYQNVLKTISERQIPTIAPEVGELMRFDDLQIEILGPVENYRDLNDMSIVLRLKYMDNTFLLTGDAEKESENDILGKFSDIRSDVLKVGHHGSETSTSQSFLEAVRPQYAAISAGAGNAYHHPHQDTLARLEQYHVTTFRTDLNGSICFYSDGKKITAETEK